MDHSKYEFLCPVCQKSLAPHPCQMHEEVHLDQDDIEYVACQEQHKFICHIVDDTIEGGGWICELASHSHNWPIGTEFPIKPLPLKQKLHKQ
jgi:hypothetical protein